MPNLTECDHLVVVDLEAKCDSRGRLPRHEMEIIEIGAVMVRRAGLVRVSEFQSFVRPIRRPQLTEFCTELTSIEQSDVAEARLFPVVAQALKEWVFARDRVFFCSWGDYDKKQLRQDAEFHGISYPMPGRHLNLKRLFSEEQHLRKKLGMSQALRAAGLELEGTHHRGIDDARNIARLLPFCLGHATGSRRGRARARER